MMGFAKLNPSYEHELMAGTKSGSVSVSGSKKSGQPVDWMKRIAIRDLPRITFPYRLSEFHSIPIPIPTPMGVMRG